MPPSCAVGGATCLRRSRFVCLLTVLVVPGLSAQEPAVPRFEAVPGDAGFPVEIPSAFRATRGYVVVAEHRGREASPEVRLPVVIIHADSRDRRLDPVLYLSGGPGTSGLSAAAFPGAYPWTGDRDFVVLGQRGTRYADPALNCPEYVEANAASGSDAERLERQVEAAKVCRHQLTERGIDPSAYHSAAIAADVADLGSVLGVEQWVLYGVSYGTRVALAFARDFPHSVSAMVLDSPLPPQARYDDESARNFQAALEAIIRDCEAREPCRSAYPDLGARFFRAIEAASRDPIAVQTPDGGSPIVLEGPQLAALVDPGSPSGIVMAPYLMNAIAEADSALIAGVAGGSSGSSDFAWGMRLSVWCSEALPFSDRAASPGPAPVLGGMESAVVDPAVCEAWDVPPRPDREAAPVVSAVPTLILAGEFDPATPPKWGRAAAETLARSRVVTVRGEGHLPTQQWGGDGCAMALVAAFIADPDSVLRSPSASEHCVFRRPGPEYRVPGGDL